ncbi:MAG: histidine--tRNA ligase [Parvularculaceae bacterium]
MTKKKKEFRPKARKPRGFRDRLGAEIEGERALIDRVRKVYESYGFDELETPAFEYTDALGKFLPDADRPNQGVFSLQDDDGQWMSLRYDLTAPLARFVAEHYDALPKPFRRYQSGRVWRNEKPGPGRYREFTQFDADTAGAPAGAADAEICALIADVMEAAGLARGDYVVRVNDRRILDGVLEVNGVTEPESKLKVMRSLDKLDRLGREGVELLLGAGRKDESGDFTEGAHLEASQVAALLDYVTVAMTERGGAEREGEWLAAHHKAVAGSAAGEAGVATLSEIFRTLRNLGYGGDRVTYRPDVVRGLEYYTGPVFEAEFTFGITGEDGAPVQLGSPAGGGRYDGLVARFKGTEIPAVGFSLGVSRLIAALDARDRRSQAVRGPVVVLALDKDDPSRAQRMAAELRAAGLRAEAYVGASGMRAQLKYADRRGAPAVVIEGEDERAKGEITIKDLILGAKLAEQIEDNKAWREDQPAQFSVARGELVDAVKKTLARHTD